MEIKNDRNINIDLAKGVAILLVLFGHSLQYGYGSDYTGFWENPLYKIIYSFHMPLFMLISGYLFWYSYQKHGGLFVLKGRCRTLCYPIFSYGVIYSLPNLVLSRPISIKVTFFEWNLWFLWSIIISTIVTTAVFYCNKKFRLPEIVMIIVLFFSMMLFSDENILAPHKYMLTYFVIGGVICKYNLTRYAQYSWIAIVAFLILIGFYSNDTYIYVSKYFALDGNLSYHIETNSYRFIVGLAGAFSAMQLIKWAYRITQKRQWNTTNSILMWFGKNTLIIYFAQSLFYTFFYKLTTSYHGWWQPYALFLIATAFSIIFVLMIQRFKIISILLFGKAY